MSENNGNINYRKLEDLTDFAANSEKEDIIIPSSKEEIAYDAKESLNYRDNNNNNDNLNIIKNNTNTDNLNNTNDNLESLYEKLIEANDALQTLNQENYNLKQVIENKDAIIADYEDTFRKTAEKLINFQKINENLKNEIRTLKQNNYNSEKDKENEIHNNNQYFLDSINEIKNNLSLIEDNYNQKINEKEDIINKLNYDLQINCDYKNHIDNAMNQICYENNILKSKICCLLKEKEILLNEKEKEHEEIIKLNEILKNIDYVKDNNYISELKDELKEKENNFKNMLKNQEKEYVLQISNLHRAIAEREKEIDILKEKYQDIIRKLNLDIESLRKKINSIENLPCKNNFQLICCDNNNII